MNLTISDYINIPSPIEKELKLLFDNSSNLTIFDIGSCEGEDSIKYSRIFPNAKIYSVEALPSNLPILYSNLDKYEAKNVEVLPIAMSNKKGKAQFFVSSGHPENLPSTSDWDYGNKSSSLLAPDQHTKYIPWLKFNQAIEVDTDTLKSICKQRRIKEIDFIHMDVQGAELKVLEGAGELINNIKSIWLEVEAVNLYLGQPLKEDVQNFMQTHLFYKLKDTVDKVSGDQFYINLRYFNRFSLMIPDAEDIFNFMRNITSKLWRSR